nr:hypothetical protein [Clostridium botulinum]
MKKNLIKVVSRGYKNKTKTEKIGKFIMLLSICLSCAIPAYASADTSAMDTLIKWLADWSMKIGLVVAFFGGIQTSLGFKNDDADGKVRGLKTLASGFMVAAISKSLDLFGL